MRRAEYLSEIPTKNDVFFYSWLLNQIVGPSDFNRALEINIKFWETIPVHQLGFVVLI
jgi:hypothetical protein